MMPALPPGFRFHPTDEELIVHYLSRQSASMSSPVPIIAEVNIYNCNPWDLPDKALFGEKEWYFFSPRDRKYPNGARPNRAAGSGYWKATGTDKAILATPTSHHIGVKKALVFYKGKPPKGSKTDWIMHEYRLTSTTATTAKRKRGSSSMRLDDWVLCRIHKKCNGALHAVEDSRSTAAASSSPPPPPPKLEALDDDDELQQLRPMAIAKSCSITDLLNTVDYAALLLDGDLQPPPPESQLLNYDTPLNPWQTTVNYQNNYYTDHDHQTSPHLAVDEHDYYAKGLSDQQYLRKTKNNSSYCNQQQLAADTKTSSSLHHQYSGGTLIHHPFTVPAAAQHQPHADHVNQLQLGVWGF